MCRIICLECGPRHSCEECAWKKQLVKDVKEFDEYFNSDKPMPLAEQVKARGVLKLTLIQGEKENT